MGSLKSLIEYKDALLKANPQNNTKIMQFIEKIIMGSLFNIYIYQCLKLEGSKKKYA